MNILVKKLIFLILTFSVGLLQYQSALASVHLACESSQMMEISHMQGHDASSTTPKCDHCNNVCSLHSCSHHVTSLLEISEQDKSLYIVQLLMTDDDFKYISQVSSALYRPPIKS